MATQIQQGQRVAVSIDTASGGGPLEMWRHGVGVGGINALPLPQSVIEATRSLRPRLIRVFIQEFFGVYPEHGRYDWTRLDAYLGSIAQTGAKMVAAICIKPAEIFGGIDHAVWRPGDLDEWQSLIRALVSRYSVERELVSHWEIGNETDIGEDGGSPFLIPDPLDYAEFYRFTASSVREAAPHVKVGGTAACWVNNEPLPGFVASCAADGTPLDFISWHIYHDDWTRHALGVREGRRLISQLNQPAPEMMVTEWNKGFDPTSVADQALMPRRAALAAASILAMHQQALDWSFYYHLWDQYVDPTEFGRFFSPAGVDNMYHHWNEAPHRFGLFSETCDIRPQYFVFDLLSRLGDTRLIATGGDQVDRLSLLSGQGPDSVSTLLANVSLDEAVSAPLLVTVTFSHLRPGPRLLSIFRIDEDCRWDAVTRQLRPLETRRLIARDEFECQLFLPADSVSMVTLSETDGAARWTP